MDALFRWRKKDSSVISHSHERYENAESSAVEERSGLFPLHDCPSNENHAVDIVAVHGLGGHWKHTWTADSNKNWLKDFLPLQLQEAGITVRLLSYGYDSDTAFSKAVTDIDDIAVMLLDRLAGDRQSPEEKSRAIIFVAHSLGGIVVKKAMILAHERSTYYGDLLQHVRAAVFLAVPHRGSDVAYWATFAANILQFGQLGLGTNPAYVKALQRNSPTFANISTQFIERAASLSIRTFYETERMGNHVIVDKDSAVLRLPNEIAVGVAQSNHKMVCKFDYRDSQKYRPVWMAIRSLAESALAVGATSVSVASSHTDALGAALEGRYRINEHDKYTVGWICALPIEMAVAVGMLDERHESLLQDKHDHNNYTLGRVGQHNVAIACLPAGVTGVTSAATVASQMRWTFSALRFGLMVGIGGGVPSEGNDIRLGDVVVSQPTGTSGGVIQYDFGKTVQEGRFERTGSLNRPPDLLLNAVASLRARHMVDEPVLSRFVVEMGSKYSRLRMASTHPGVETDQLFEAEYDHPVGEASCTNCDISRVVRRDGRVDRGPVIHYGLVASGNQVMRDGRTRERLRREMNVLCFEMEAAGLMDNFPCLVVRGICDYADSHKNKQWQPYAASTAAGYAKELLNIISGSQVVGTRTVGEIAPAMLN